MSIIDLNMAKKRLILALDAPDLSAAGLIFLDWCVIASFCLGSLMRLVVFAESYCSGGCKYIGRPFRAQPRRTPESGTSQDGGGS